MVNETGNRNRILEMCKFWIWIQLGITSTILYRFSPNFACGSEMWSLRRLLFVTQTGSILLILVVCGFRFRQFLGSGEHFFQQISTRSHVQIKFCNADFVCRLDFIDVKILVSVSALDRPAFDRTRLCLCHCIMYMDSEQSELQ